MLGKGRRYSQLFEIQSIEWGLILSLLLAAILRVLYIDMPIRFDEAANVLYYSDRSMAHAAWSAAGNENHALNSVLTWFSLRLFGFSVESSRLAVLLAGVAFVGVIWLLTYSWSNCKKTSTLAGLITAISPWLIFYSVVGRGYMYQSVFFGLMLWRIHVCQTREKCETQHAVSLGVLGLLGFIAAKSMAWYIVIAIVYHFIQGRAVSGFWPHATREGRRFLVIWLGTLAAGTLIYFAAPLYYYGVTVLLGATTGFSTPPDLAALSAFRRIMLTPGRLYGMNEYSGVLGHQIIATVVTVVFLAGFFMLRKKMGHLIWVLLAAVVAGVVLAMAGKTPMPPRVMVPLTVLIIPFFAYGLIRLLSFRNYVYPIPLLVCASFAYIVISSDTVGDWMDSGNASHAEAISVALLDYGGTDSMYVLATGLVDCGIAFYLREKNQDIDGIYTLDLRNASHDNDRSRLAVVLDTSKAVHLDQLMNIAIGRRLVLQSPLIKQIRGTPYRLEIYRVLPFQAVGS